MSAYEIRSAKIIDRSSERSWSQVHVFSSPELRPKKHRGQVWAVFHLELGSNKNHSLVEIGRELITRFHEEYYGRSKGESDLVLVSALKKIGQELPAGIRFEAAAAILIDDRLTIGLNGETRVYLRRASRWEEIGVGEGVETSLFSGQIRAGDWLVLGSGDFWEAVSEPVLTASSIGDFERVVEALNPVVCGLGRGAPAGVLVTFDELEKRDQQPILKRKKWHLGKPKRRRLGWLQKLEYRQMGSGEKLKSSTSHKRKKWFWFLLIGLLLGIVILVRRFLFFSDGSHEQDQLVKAELARISQEIQVDSDQAREQIGMLADEVAQTQDESLAREYSRVLGLAWQETEVEKLDLFFDLDLIESAAHPSQFFTNGRWVVVLDRSGQLAYQIEGETGRGEPFLFEGAEEKVISLAGDGQEIYFLTHQGIGQIDQEGLLIETDLTGDEELAVFADNFYLLDPASWEIYRFAWGETGFGDRSRWLQEVVRRSGRPVKLIVDGEIWILDDEGEITRLSRGAPVSFFLDSPRQPLNKVVDLAVGEEKIFVLTEDGQRLVVYNRLGSYLAQYSWPEIRVEKITLSADGQRMWLLADTKIYQLKLK